MTKRIEVSGVMPEKQKDLYEARLDSDKHNAFGRPFLGIGGAPQILLTNNLTRDDRSNIMAA